MSSSRGQQYERALRDVNEIRTGPELGLAREQQQREESDSSDHVVSADEDGAEAVETDATELTADEDEEEAGDSSSSNDNDDAAEGEDEDDEEQEDFHAFLFGGAACTGLEEALKSLRDAQPHSLSTTATPRTKFDAYWCTALSNLSPDARPLFKPPCPQMCVNVTNKPKHGHFCCECDLPDDLPSFTVAAQENLEMGVTVGDLVKGISDALYGVEGGHGSRKIGGEEDRLVIQRFGWMTASGELMGSLYLYVEGFAVDVA